MTLKVKNVCCIGAGFVGGPTMTVLANKCKDIVFHVVDKDKSKIEQWNSQDLSDLPVYEPGLAELIEKRRDKNLFFSNLVKESISKAELIFICVNTPTKKSGIGAGKASDMKWIEACAREVATYAEGETIVVEKSTLPVKTAETIKKILFSLNKENYDKKFSILSNPEFLAEGNAINDLENPDRILIGGDDNEAISLLEAIYLRWVDKNKILRTNLWSSELSKLTANAFLAQRISSINSISALCEKTGAEIKEVSKAVGMDSRIGSNFLSASPGFGGSCFKKDLLNLIYICNYYNLDVVADYWQKVIDINEWQNKRISKIVTEKMFGTIYKKKIAILGFSFKANTNDTRESPAINVCLDLLEEGAMLKIYDPRVKSNQIEQEIANNKDKNINYEGQWLKVENIYESFNEADAIIILTEWQEFQNLNWKEISSLMKKPSWVFDTRLILNPEILNQYNFDLWSLGSTQ